MPGAARAETDTNRTWSRRALGALALLAALAAGPAAAAGLASCVQKCQDECNEEAKNCVKAVQKLCRLHPALGQVCRTVYVQNCRSSGTYCRLVNCGLITSCDPPPDPDPDPDPGDGGGKSRGEPHLYTFDGLAYSLQAAGEFVLAQSPARDFVVQARQEPFVGSRSVSANTAFALRVGADRVGLYASAPEGVRVNGQLRRVGVAETLDLPGGGQVARLGDGEYTVSWPQAIGGEVRVALGVWSDIDVRPPVRLKGGLVGLLGNFNGRRDDDLQVRPGTNPALSWRPGQGPIGIDELYGVFARSWRVSAEESLFDYGPGESAAGFALPGFPERHLSLADLPVDRRAAARAHCRGVGVAAGPALDDCSFDVALTGNNALASAFRGLGRLEPLAVASPIYLDGWRQQGQPGDGRWTVAADGRSVSQSVNGGASFFVGPRELIDVTIRGQIQIGEAGDDDMVGFVLGWRGPAAPGQDADFVLLDWKRGDQSSDGHEVQAGLRLARFQGPVPDELAAYWGMVDGPTVKRLATDLGPDKGWKVDTAHRFEARYGRERLQVFIDGVKVFDVKGRFEPGRFGFYNYSQEAVVYSGFELVEGVQFD